MKCPTCGNETEGRNHNNRGLRCTFCWSLLPDMAEKPKTAPNSKRKVKPKAASVTA